MWDFFLRVIKWKKIINNYITVCHRMRCCNVLMYEKNWGILMHMLHIYIYLYIDIWWVYVCFIFVFCASYFQNDWKSVASCIHTSVFSRTHARSMNCRRCAAEISRSHIIKLLSCEILFSELIIFVCTTKRNNLFIPPQLCARATLYVFLTAYTGTYIILYVTWWFLLISLFKITTNF